MLRRPSCSTLFPYTTLFRSVLRFVNVHTRSRSQLRGRFPRQLAVADRKSTRLNSSHVESSYAVFCLKKNTSLTCLEYILPSLVVIRTPRPPRPEHLRVPVVA